MSKPIADTTKGCLKCSHPGAHYVPPSFSDAGFYACESFCDVCRPASASSPAEQNDETEREPMPTEWGVYIPAAAETNSGPNVYVLYGDCWRMSPDIGNADEHARNAHERWGLVSLRRSSPASTTREETEKFKSAISKARDLIGNQSGDITGAALDAWVILCDVLPAEAPVPKGDE